MNVAKVKELLVEAINERGVSASGRYAVLILNEKIVVVGYPPPNYPATQVAVLTERQCYQGLSPVAWRSLVVETIKTLEKKGVEI